MTKAELVRRIANAEGVDPRIVDRVIVCWMELARRSLIKGGNLYFRRFGTFYTQILKKRYARNITRGIPIVVPERWVVCFRVSPAFRKAVAEGGE